jgi:hypothetical protein
LLGNSAAKKPVVRQWLTNRHMTAATDTQAIMEYVFSVGYVPRLCNEEQLPLLVRVVFVRIDELSVSYRGVEKQCRFSENSYKVIASRSDLWSE